jgi:ribose transport system substrate-binding protein
MPDSVRRAVAALAMALIALAAVTACSSSTTRHTGSGSDASSLSQAGQDRLAALLKGTGTPPAPDGPKALSGKNIWFIASGMSVESVAVGVAGFQDAAKSMGWHTTVVDGKFEPNLFLSGIEQAVAARADGIVIYAIDCASVKNGLEAAKSARIPVVGIESQNCDPSLESVIPYAAGDFAAWGRQLGSDMALWMSAQAKGSGTIIDLRETDLEITRAETAGVKASFATDCPHCKLVPVEFTATDIGPGLQQKVGQAILQNPTAIGVIVPYDDLLISGVSSAVVSSGRVDQLKVISVGGTTPALDIMRQHRGLNADLVVDTRWEGFGAADWMNRLLHGQTPDPKTAATGIGHQLISASHLPAAGLVPDTVDFAAIYDKSWGVQ